LEAKPAEPRVVSAVPRPSSLALDASATFTTYDALSRPLTVVDGGGGTTTYAYNQNDVLVTVSPAPSGENTKQRQFTTAALAVALVAILGPPLSSAKRPPQLPALTLQTQVDLRAFGLGPYNSKKNSFFSSLPMASVGQILSQLDPFTKLLPLDENLAVVYQTNPRIYAPHWPHNLEAWFIDLRNGALIHHQVWRTRLSGALNERCVGRVYPLASLQALEVRRPKVTSRLQRAAVQPDEPSWFPGSRDRNNILPPSMACTLQKTPG
jgi:YD repeat-containing protein